ncbi:unnamed protein product [Toxocara canis]|uniref:Uncharacterized protein n=1 Tax=Toxocara canis TaxID=6265 RepID=A0A183TYM5_TOXCA|nr:unnamed protein product [Toxocara canis]
MRYVAVKRECHIWLRWSVCTSSGPSLNVNAIVAIRESYRNDLLNVLSDKKLSPAIRKFNSSDSLAQSASQRFILRW